MKKNDITTATVCRRLKDIRLIRGIKQSDLAKGLGVKPPTIAQYESGRRVPKRETVERICAELDVYPSLAYLEDDSWHAFLLLLEQSASEKNMALSDAIQKNNVTLEAGIGEGLNHASRIVDTCTSSLQHSQAAPSLQREGNINRKRNVISDRHDIIQSCIDYISNDTDLQDLVLIISKLPQDSKRDLIKYATYLANTAEPDKSS